MKNLKKLSRNKMKMKFGGGGPNQEVSTSLENSIESSNGGQWCHFHYTGSLWGNDMKITSYGSGACHSGGGKCYKYFATGSCY